MKHYTRAVLWSGRFVRDDVFADVCIHGISKRIGESLRADPRESYWQNARAFLVLAALTGQLDMLKDVAPTEIRAPFEKWERWLRVTSERLVFVRTLGKVLENLREPKGTDLFPFPDWTGVPPPPREIISIFANGIL